MAIKTYTGNEGIRDADSRLFVGLLIRDTIKQSNQSVGTSAAKLPTSPLSRRKFMVVFNNSANILYLGASDVSTTNGYPVYPRAAIQINIEDDIDVYAVAAGASSDIRLLEGA